MNLVYLFCQKSSWFEWEIISQRSFNAKEKMWIDKVTPHWKKERKVGDYIKPKYGLFKLVPWAPQVFKCEKLYIK